MKDQAEDLLQRVILKYKGYHRDYITSYRDLNNSLLLLFGAIILCIGFILIEWIIGHEVNSEKVSASIALISLYSMYVLYLWRKVIKLIKQINELKFDFEYSGLRICYNQDRKFTDPIMIIEVDKIKENQIVLPEFKKLKSKDYYKIFK